MDAAQIDRDLKALQALAHRLVQHLDDLSITQINALAAALLDLAPAYQLLASPQITERLPGTASRLVVEHQRSKALLEEIFNTTPAGLAVVTGENLTFSYANPVYRFTCPPTKTNLNGVSYAEVWAGDPAASFAGALYETLKTGRPFQVHDFERTFPDGSTRTFVFQARRMQWDKEYAVLLVLWDITERKQVEEALKESERKYQDVIRYAPAGIYEVDFRNKRFISVNDMMCQLSGYSREELMEMSPFDLLDEHGRTLFQQRITRWLAGEKPEENVVYRVRAKDGHEIQALLNVTFIADEKGQPLGATVVGFDVTQQRKAQEELMAGKAQIEVQRRLLNQREQERLQIARNLHDGPIQDLLGVIYDVKNLALTNQNPDVVDQIVSIQAALHALTTELRAYSQELRPPALSRFGLDKAIQSHLKVFQDKHPNIKVHFDARWKGAFLAENARLALYRIYQEAMANLIRHSGASEVNIRLKTSDQTAFLEISDNGKGFQVPDDWLELAREGHLGLVGMRERAEAVGGHMKIESEPGKGVTVCISVPLSDR